MIEIIVKENKEDYKQEIIKYIKEGYKIKSANISVTNYVQRLSNISNITNMNNLTEKQKNNYKDIMYFAIMEKEE